MEDLSQQFKILEVDFNADFRTIQKSYHELCKVWHPDRFSANDIQLKQKAEARLKELNDAYAKISSWFNNNKNYISYSQYINQRKYQTTNNKTKNNADYTASSSKIRSSTTNYNPNTNYKPVVIIILLIAIIGSFVWFDNQQKNHKQMRATIQELSNQRAESEKKQHGIKIIVSGTNGTKINVKVATRERSDDFDTVVPYETTINGDSGNIVFQKRQPSGEVKLKIIDGAENILYEGKTNTNYGMLNHKFMILPF